MEIHIRATLRSFQVLLVQHQGVAKVFYQQEVDSLIQRLLSKVLSFFLRESKKRMIAVKCQVRTMRQSFLINLNLISINIETSFQLMILFINRTNQIKYFGSLPVIIVDLIRSLKQNQSDHMKQAKRPKKRHIALINAELRE